MNATDSNNITSAMVSLNGVYAFRVENGEKLLQFYNSLDDLMDDKKTKFKDYLESMYQRDVVQKSQEQCNNTCTDEQYCEYLHNNFRKFFNGLNKSIGLGMKLYFAPHTESGIYTWTKLSTI